jgi:hypothetical protein
MPSKIIVRRGLNEPPLLVTDKAQQIEFYDHTGALVALIGHVFSDDYWYYSSRADADWEQVLERTGFKDNLYHTVGSGG